MIRKFIRTRREKRVRKLNERIEHLSACIRGTDEWVYPEFVLDYQRDRQRAAIERVELLNKLAKES